MVQRSRAGQDAGRAGQAGAVECRQAQGPRACLWALSRVDLAACKSNHFVGGKAALGTESQGAVDAQASSRCMLPATPSAAAVDSTHRPPGNSHIPASFLPGGRCASSTRPLASSRTTATTRTSGFPSLLAAAGGAAAAAPAADAIACTACLCEYATRGLLADQLRSARGVARGCKGRRPSGGGRLRGANRQRCATAPALWCKKGACERDGRSAATAGAAERQGGALPAAAATAR